MNIGDLVRHTHLGGLAIVTGDNGTVLILKWLVPHTDYDERGRNRYFPRFLEAL